MSVLVTMLGACTLAPGPLSTVSPSGSNGQSPSSNSDSANADLAPTPTPFTNAPTGPFIGGAPAPASIGGQAPTPGSAAVPQTTPVASSPPTAAAPTPMPLGQTGKWKLTFDDEFNGNQLNTTKWVAAYPWGSSACTLSDMTPKMAATPQNVIVSGGTLKLRALDQSVNCDGHTYPYSSGMVTTAKYDNEPGGTGAYRFLQEYGYYEVRMRIPAGKGLWTAVALFPPGEQWPPEIDLMEIRGEFPNRAEPAFHFLDQKGRDQAAGTPWISPVSFAAGWHTFAVDWEPNAIRWFIDGVARGDAFTYPQYIPHTPMYLMLALDVGGTWNGDPNASTHLPADLEFDYVRVWQHA